MRSIVILLSLTLACGDDAQSGGADGATVGSQIISVAFDGPKEGAVAGTVQIAVHAVPAESVAKVELVTPSGLTDDDPAPDRLASVWDTSAVPDGPITLVTRATDHNGRVAIGQVTVTVNNAGASSVGGRAMVGRPVRGAAVEVLAFGGLVEGAVLGTATTDDLGYFKAVVDVPGYDDVVLVRVEGGTYVDLVTGQDAAFGASERIETAVRFTDGQPAGGTLVTPLTTLGVSLAQGRLAQGGTSEEAVTWAMSAVRDHVFRPDAEGRDIRDVAPLAVVDSTGLPDQAVTAVGLVHAGLSQMGAPLAVTRALARDLEDALFNGKDGAGAEIQLDGQVLDPELTRAPLAAAIDVFVAGARNGTGLTYADLAAPGLLYDDLSLDDGPLYPPGSVVGYDPEPPQLAFVAPTPPGVGWQSQAFTVVVQGVDKSLPLAFTIVSPKALPSAKTESSLTLSVDPASMVPGPLKVEVRAVDAAGNEATVSRDVQVDAVPPTIAITAPFGWTTDAAVTLQGVASDGKTSGIASVTVSVDGEVVEATIGEGDTWTAAVALGSSGMHDFVATATDVAGNSAQATGKVGLDSSAPSVTIEVPKADHPYRSGALTVVAPVFDTESQIASANATIAGVTVDLDVIGATATGIVAVPAIEGEASVTVTAVSGAGTEASATAQFIVDDTPPAVDALVLGGKSQGLQWITSANPTLKLVNVRDEGPPNALDEKGTVKVSGYGKAVTVAFGVQDDYDVALDLTGAGASGVLTVVLADAAGNETAKTIDVAIDVTPPVLEVTSHDANDWVATSTVTLKGTAEDVHSGTESVIVSVGSQVAVADYVAGDWSVTLDLGADAAFVPISIKATDIAGNGASLSWFLGVDLTPPGLTVVSPAEGQPYRSSVPLPVELLLAEAQSGVAYATATVDPVTSGLSVLGNTAKGTISLSPIEGPVSMMAAATNGAGLASTATVGFLVDDSPPVYAGLHLGVEANGTHWLKSSASVLVLEGVHDEGPANGLVTKGVATVAGEESLFSDAFGELGDLAIPVLIAGTAEGLKVSVADAAGNETHKYIYAKVDSLAPAVAVTSPKDGSWLPTSTLTIMGTVTEWSSGVASIVVEVPGHTAQATVANGSWSAAVTLPGTGQSKVTITATDVAGNASTTTWSVGVDSTPPVLDVQFPKAGAAYKSGTLQIVAGAHDGESKIAEVSIPWGNGKSVLTYDATAEVATGTKDVPKAPEVQAIEVKATNGAGLETKKTVTFFVDDAPPTYQALLLGKEIDGSRWLTSPIATLTLKGLADVGPAGAGTVTITGDGVALEESSFSGSVDLAIPLDLTGKLPVALVITVKDSAGNLNTSKAVYVKLDSGTPNLFPVTPMSGLGIVWTNKAKFDVEALANDAGSGLAGAPTVKVGSAAAKPMTPTTGMAFKATVDLVQASQEVVVEVADKVGWKTSYSVTVNLDTVAPVVEQVETKYDRETSALYADPCSSVPQLSPTLNKHSLSTEAFKSPLVKIEKLANRLEYAGVTDVATFNLPAIRVDVSDGQGSSLVDLALTYEFKRSEATLKSGTLPKAGVNLESDWFQVPIAIPFFSTATGAADFTWVAENLPDTLVIKAVDLAGNATVKTFNFTLAVHGPPLCFEKSPDLLPGPNDTSAFTFKNGTLATMFKTGQSDTRIGQVRVRNPFPVPLRFTLGATGPAKIAFESARAAIYLGTSTTGCSVSSCAVGQCVLCSASSQSCQSWSSAAIGNTQVGSAGNFDLALSVHLPVNKDALNVKILPDPKGEWLVPAEETRYVNILGKLGGTCGVNTPKVFGFLPDIYALYVEHKGTGCSAPSPTTDDQVVCKMTSTSNRFIAPRIYTEIVLQTQTIDASSGLGSTLGDLAPHPSVISSFKYTTRSVSTVPLKPPAPVQ